MLSSAFLIGRYVDIWNLRYANIDLFFIRSYIDIILFWYDNISFFVIGRYVDILNSRYADIDIYFIGRYINIIFFGVSTSTFLLLEGTLISEIRGMLTLAYFLLVDILISSFFGMSKSTLSLLEGTFVSKIRGMLTLSCLLLEGMLISSYFGVLTSERYVDIWNSRYTDIIFLLVGLLILSFFLVYRHRSFCYWKVRWYLKFEVCWYWLVFLLKCMLVSSFCMSTSDFFVIGRYADIWNSRYADNNLFVICKYVDAILF